MKGSEVYVPQNTCPQMFAGRGTHMCICYIQHRLGRLLTLYQDLYSEVQTHNCGWRTYPLVQRSWWHHWGGLYAFLLWISYLEVITPGTSWKQFSHLQSSGIKTVAKDHGYKQWLSWCAWAASQRLTPEFLCWLPACSWCLHWSNPHMTDESAFVNPSALAVEQ